MSPLVIKQIKKKMEKKRTVSTNRSKSKKKDPAIASARGSGRKATPFSALPRPLISELTFKQPSSLVPGQAEVSQHQYNTRSAQNRHFTSSPEHQVVTNPEQQQQSSIRLKQQTFTASASSSSLSSSSADEMIKELLQKNAIIIPEQSKKGRKKKEIGKPNKELLDLLHNSANVNPNEALKQLRTLKQDQRKSKMTGENETEKRKEREQQQENSIRRSISTLNGIEFASSNLALTFKEYGVQTQPTSSSTTQSNTVANRHRASQPPPSIGSDKDKPSDE
ncbi:MAG: hypothetical protein EZS28_048998, partial [Streblomastix strix]